MKPSEIPLQRRLNLCICLTRGDETDSNPEMQRCGPTLKTEVCKPMPRHVGLATAVNAALCHSPPPICQTATVAVVR